MSVCVCVLVRVRKWSRFCLCFIHFVPVHSFVLDIILLFLSSCSLFSLPFVFSRICTHVWFLSISPSFLVSLLLPLQSLLFFYMMMMIIIVIISICLLALSPFILFFFLHSLSHFSCALEITLHTQSIVWTPGRLCSMCNNCLEDLKMFIHTVNGIVIWLIHTYTVEIKRKSIYANSHEFHVECCLCARVCTNRHTL